MNSLVGRDRELAIVDNALAALGAERSPSLIVTGEPGIGKTRILQEVAARARTRGLGVLSGTGTEFERTVPYAVTVDALRRAVGELVSDQLDRLSPAQVAELAMLFPSLGTQSRPADVTLAADRFRLHRAVAGLLEILAAERPLALLLDDLHWADAASLELVAYLLRRPVTGVLPVLAFRGEQAPDLLVRAIATPVGRAEAGYLDLAPLDAGSADAFLDGVDPARRPEILRQSGGNPFYLTELAGAVRGGASIPPALRDALVAELSALSPGAQTLLRAAAVAGDPFEYRLACEIAELADPERLEASEQLLGGTLVRPTDTPQRYAFRHPIVRTIVYDWAGEARTVDAHRRAVDVLAARGTPATGLAHHLERSARPGDLAAVGLLADASASVATRAPAAAAAWCGAALRLLPADADSSMRLNLLASRALALVSIGQRREARETLVEALEVLGPETTPARLEVIANLARVEIMIGRFSAARALLERSLAETTDAHTAGSLELELGVALWHAGEWRTMAQHTRAALETSRKLGDGGIQLAAGALVSLGEQHDANPAAARAALSESNRLLRSLSMEAVASRPDGVWFLAYAAFALEHFEEAHRLHERVIEVARSMNQEMLYLLALGGLGMTRRQLGRLEDGRLAAEEAVEAAVLLDDAQGRMWAFGIRGYLHLARGDLAAALRDGQRSKAELEGAGAAMFGSLATCFLGEAQLEMGDPDAAIRSILDPIGAGPELERLEPYDRPYWAALLAEAELARGNLEVARSWVERASTVAAAVELRGRHGDGNRARALLALADNDPETAVTAAATAAEDLDSVGRRVGAARARTVQGRALAAAGDRDSAVELLSVAREELAAIGAVRYRDAAADALRTLGGRVARGATGHRGVHALSRREREVADLVARGLTNREIASELHLSQKTIESHLWRTFAKLDVSTRAAVARALERAAYS